MRVAGRDERAAVSPGGRTGGRERTGLSAFVSTRHTDCQVPSAGRPSSTGTVIDGATNAGSTWSRPWPGLPWRCRQRSSAGSRSRSAASRSVSLPAPVSITARPAVACGTQTCSRPSRAPAERRNAAISLGQVDDALRCRRSGSRSSRSPRRRPYVGVGRRAHGIRSRLRRPRRLPEHREHRHPAGRGGRRGGRRGAATGGRGAARPADFDAPVATARAAFGELVGVPADRVAIGATGPGWSGWSRPACPTGPGCWSPRGEFTSVTSRSRRSAGAG